jgi:phosphate transport system protein
MQLRRLDQELEKLKSMLLEMSVLVEAAVSSSITALVEQDRNLAEEVLRTEKRVNQMELAIDHHAISLLALQQTMASDLRLITSSLKINTQLERMGDLGATIAREARDLMDEPIVEPRIDIPRIASLVQSMMRGALDSYVARDAEVAAGVLAADDAVDRLRTSFVTELSSFMQREPGKIRQALRLLTVVGSLERIADHSTNIAEDVLFYVRGVDVRHRVETPANFDTPAK